MPEQTAPPRREPPMEQTGAPREGVALAAPVRFLAAFAAVAALTTVAWSQVSGHYLVGLIHIANGCLKAAAVPLLLEVPPALPGQLVHPEVIGAVALFLTTPRRCARWRCGWLVPVLLGLAALHTAFLFGDTWMVYRLRAGGAAMAPFGVTGSQVLELCRMWLPSLAVAAAWFAAVGSTGRHGPPP